MDVQKVVGTLLAVVVGCYLLEALLVSRRDPKEPVYIRPSVPLLGHLFGFLKKGTPYLVDVEAKHPSLGIFSLPIFSFKIYVVANQQIYAAVQRNAKTLSFSPFAKKVTKTLSDVSDTTLRSVDILADDEEARNYARQIQHVHATALAAGPSLDRLNLATAQEMLRFVDESVAESSKGPVQMELFDWVRHVITMAATTGFYGPKNPYRDPQHEKDFWTFHAQLPLLSSGLAWLLAPRAVKARDANSRRYEAYIHDGGVETASDVIKERTRIFLQNGSPLVDAARMNTGLDTALISNYVMTAFWAIYDVFSRPELLTAIREEVTKAVDKGDDGLTLDLSVLRTSCPLLVSSLQETQRLRSGHANVRAVISDTSLNVGDREYLLKKGNYVNLHNHVPLHNKEVWGEDAETFDPYRFIRMKKGADGGVVPPSQLPSSSFPVWGAAPHVCPARYHASTGVLVLMALVALRLDVLPGGSGRQAVREDGSAKWKDVKPMAGFTAVFQPGEPVPVVVKPREGLEGKWGVRVGTPNTRLLFSIA
ncbi:7-alpha-hydroxycholest-4-en-3-one 12-alpha-hydroxylase [Cytospora mali]|uniref:7-alpha-hydroxycholest-4-en-3-one 12-alpha-hydroxylase n=1 Tax=Cytospora mali TaxID=578113 RepID=A0A194VFN6_CYTMA|nr:7-alpha-hydroxycholest-4-en-3-one 12-alpha-hydroxylase [Valsa mali var. pyri (nom. inval.)]